MGRILAMAVIAAAFVLPSSGQGAAITQKDACSRFSDAVVEIDAGGESKGSGFLVSEDGYILTAGHVMMDSDGTYHPAIFVTLSSGEILTASPAAPLSIESLGQDFAILKVNYKKPLPFLPLGGMNEVEVGGDATIIGFPFSAISPTDNRISKKFCLQASFAAVDGIRRTVRVDQKTRTGIVPFQEDVGVDVIYFQGPSVKGISGSPIISRDSGHVVGIVSTKLTGIGPALDNARAGLVRGGDMLMNGVSVTGTLTGIITVLDQQLANGLGSAVGIDDAKEALKRAEKNKR